MNKDEILAKSRQENKDKDLYTLSIEKSASRVGVITMFAVALILTLISVIQTGKLNFTVWIMTLSVDTAMDVYRAVKFKTKKAILSAIITFAADVAVTALFFNDLYNV